MVTQILANLPAFLGAGLFLWIALLFTSSSGTVVKGDVAAVRRVAEKAVSGNDAILILRSCAQRNDRAAVPYLKASIASWSSDPQYAAIAFNALHALSELDEDPAFFYRWLDDDNQDRWLKSCSILILGRRPDHGLMIRLERMRAALKNDTDPRIGNAISYVEEVWHEKKAIDQLADTKHRIDRLLKHAGSTWTAIGGMSSDSIGDGRPLPYWAREQLVKLSSDHGDLIAQRLAVLDVGGGYGEPGQGQRYIAEARAYIAQFLPTDVRATYDRLSKEK